MVEVQTLWTIPWAVVGIFCLLRWKLKEAEVTLLDLIFCVVLGALCGPVLPLLKWLNNVTIKGGQHGTE